MKEWSTLQVLVAMIVVKTAHFTCDENVEVIAARLNRRTAKGFWLELKGVSSWYVDPERPLVGQKDTDGTLVTRYRSPLEFLIPRIFVKWVVDDVTGKTVLLAKFRLGLWPFLLFLLVALALCSQLVSFIMGLNKTRLIESVSTPILVLAIGFGLLKWEISKTRALIMKIISGD